MLRAAARRAGAWQEFTIGLLIRHCTTEGLDMARLQMDSLSEYSMGPIIRAIHSVSGLAATDVLATAVRRISVRRHPLWQEGESFALAVQRLWEFAQAGDETAQLALRVVGRRWKRIPPETLAVLADLSPGFTQAVARSGGVPPP